MPSAGFVREAKRRKTTIGEERQVNLGRELQSCTGAHRPWTVVPRIAKNSKDNVMQSRVPAAKNFQKNFTLKTLLLGCHRSNDAPAIAGENAVGSNLLFFSMPPSHTKSGTYNACYQFRATVTGKTVQNASQKRPDLPPRSQTRGTPRSPFFSRACARKPRVKSGYGTRVEPVAGVSGHAAKFFGQPPCTFSRIRNTHLPGGPATNGLHVHRAQDPQACACSTGTQPGSVAPRERPSSALGH
jgi:hypothetical protein